MAVAGSRRATFAMAAMIASIAIVPLASAQDVVAEPTEPSVVAEPEVATPVALEEAETEAPRDPAPVPITRRTTPPSPEGYDTELPPLSLAPPPSAGFEIAIAMNANLSFGGGGLAPAIATTTDLMVALDPQAWIGLGLSLSYFEQRTVAFPGSPEMRFVTTTISVPLLFQYYFAHPELGAAVPTLRLRLAAAWAETPNQPNPSTQTAGADLALYGGVTWMGASWIALRILGGLNGGFRATIVGTTVISASIGVEALIAAVVRL